MCTHALWNIPITMFMEYNQQEKPNHKKKPCSITETRILGL